MWHLWWPMGPAFLQVLQPFLVNIFPPVFHTHISFIYHWHFTILAININKTLLPPPTNPTWIALESNPSLHSGTPANTHLSYGTTMVTYVIPSLHAISFHSITLLHGLNTMQWLVHMNNLHAFPPSVNKNCSGNKTHVSQQVNVSICSHKY
jgi:hypothetical protein